MLRADDNDETEGLREPVRRILSKKYVHYKRVGEILAALSRFGFGRLWDSANLLADMPFDAEERKEVAELKTSIRFRLLLENLGPTFIKLGQMLSTRSDLIPEEYAEELGKLRDDVPPIPYEKVKQIIEEELRGSISETFKSFEEKPIAAASIGQVHVAVLKDNSTKVAVKVQRPNIKEIIDADMQILNNMADMLKRIFKEIENFDPQGIINEFGHMIKREIDYTLEGRNIERFKKNLNKLENVVIPKVYWDYSTRKVLTMDFIDGVSLDSKEKLRELKVDYKKITNTLGGAYIKQIFIDGFFHADPHHDNIFALRDGRVCFLDFGAIGYMDDETRELVGSFYIALIQKNIGRAASALIELSKSPEKDVDVQRLQWDLRDFIDYTFMKKDKVTMDKGANQRMVDIAMRHKVMLPSSFFLLERALMQVEGVCRELNPDFDILEIAQENILPLLRERYRERADPLQTLESAREYRKLASTLPKRLDNILKKLESDQFYLKVDEGAFSELKSYVRKVGLILAASIMAAALIIYIAWSGQVIELEFLPITLTMLSIFIIWVIVVFTIYRRL